MWRTTRIAFLLGLGAILAGVQLAVAPAEPLRPRGVLTQKDFLVLAEKGIADARSHWWNRQLGWYDDRLDNAWNPHMPLAYLWSAFPLFEAVDAVALAEPTAANREAVARFASTAERYWNPSLKPRGAFAYYIDTHDQVRAYFDDNGWWGIAFVDAFRATGDTEYLRQADRAFRFIVLSGWDPDGGGIWWDTGHGHTTAEPLAAAAYVGAFLYKETHKPFYLQQVTKLLRWADAHTVDPRTGLYTRNATDGTVMDYVQGIMIGTDLTLCDATRETAYCRKAEQLGRASAHVFPADLDWSATADGMYLRFLLDLYRKDGDRLLYELVYRNAQRALADSRLSDGLFLRDWSGRPVAGGMLRTHAGSVALLAWLATAPAPSR
jgi:hypothetical protein